MDYFRTQYEKCYEGDEYYWGLEPAPFLDSLVEITAKKATELKVLDIGCGEGKDAVFLAKNGYIVSAFDAAEKGLEKARELALKNKTE